MVTLITILSSSYFAENRGWLGSVANHVLGSRKWRVCEHRSGVYFWCMSSGAQQNCHLQAAKT